MVYLLGEVEKQEQFLNPKLESEYGWCDGVGESKAVAMNAVVDFPDDGDERQIGDAIQLQLAAHAAFGKAKGKGFKGICNRYWSGVNCRSNRSLAD